MELFMGKLLFNTSSTYEHLLMMEKILGSSWELTQATFPQSMIAQIKNKEVTALFDLNRQKVPLRPTNQGKRFIPTQPG
jgi:hypothetical protein